MLIPRVLIVQAENSNGICDIRLSGSHQIHKSSDRWLINGWNAGFFVRYPLVKLHRNWRGNWSGLVHSELRQDHLSVAVLLDVDSMMLPIRFDIHAGINEETPQIMLPEPRLQLVLHLAYQAVVSNDMENIDVPTDRGNDSAFIFIIEHEQSPDDMWCLESNDDHVDLKSAIYNVGRRFQDIKWLSEAEYHVLRSLWSMIVESAHRLNQTKLSLRWVHMDLFLHVVSQKRRGDVHLMDLGIVLGGNGECKPTVAQVSSWCILGLEFNAFDLLISSTH